MEPVTAGKDKSEARPASENSPPATSAALPPAIATLDMTDPDFMRTAYDTYESLRDKGRVVRVAVPALEKDEDDEDAENSALADVFGKDAFFVTRYEEALAGLLDERFSASPRAGVAQDPNAPKQQTPEEFKPFERSLLSLDPPDHTRLRRLVQPSFSASAMEALRPRIQKIADDLLDAAERAAKERGEVSPDRTMDLVKAYAYPMPVTVISDMVGIPLEDREMVKGWTETLLTNRRRGRFTKENRAKLREFIAYLRDLFTLKRKNPADDMISQLVHVQEEGDVLDDDELLSMVFIVYLAGHVTTVNLIGNGVIALLANPSEADRLRANLDLAKGVVEETLRYWGPVDNIIRRVATTDVKVGETLIPKGERMIVGLAAADHDPSRFPEPEKFDITRADASRHMAFGKGIHLCLGAPLARIEGQIAFETLFRRFPSLRLAVPVQDLNWNGSFLRGFTSIPLQF